MEELRMGGLLHKCTKQEIFHLSKCIHKVKRLNISGIGMTFDGLKQLSEAIINLNEPVCIVFYVPFAKNLNKQKPGKIHRR